MAKENTGSNQLLGSNPIIPKGLFVFDSNTGIVLVGDGVRSFRDLLRRAQTAQRGSVKVNWGNIGGAIADQTDLQTEFNTKQDTLVSGTNIKTVNGTTLLGSGNLSISTSAAWGSITGTLSDQTDLNTALGNKQPLDADLTSWAAVARATGFDTFTATPSSANLRGLLTDETGGGAAVFADSPTLTGTVAMAAATMSGKMTTYNNIATANNGLAASVGTPVHLTGQSAGAGATTFYTTDADGFYQATVQAAITTTGGTSVGVQIRFTNQADNVVKTMPSNNTNGVNQCASSSTANAVCYTVTCYCKTGTNIQYIVNLGGSGQQYSLDAFVIKL